MSSCWCFAPKAALLLCLGLLAFSTQGQELIHWQKLHGPERQAAYFKDLYIDANHQKSIMRQIMAQPSFEFEDQTEPWKCIGPAFSYDNAPVTPSSRINTGRVVGVEWTELGGLRALSASGGLWVNDCAMPCSTQTGEAIYNWKPISDQLPSLRGGAFASNPQNPNTIMLGTGEPYIGGGTGLYITHNRGEDWQEVSLPQFNKEFYRVVFDPIDTAVVHVAGNQGYYRSTNGGLSFERRSVGVITDIDLNPQNPRTVYFVKQGSGYFRSLDQGFNWAIIASAPNVNLGRSEFAVCAADTSLLLTTATTNASGYYGNKWVYRSTNWGTTWDSCTFAWNCTGNNCNFYDNQAWYNNALAINPVDCSVFIGGGVALIRGENSPDSCWLTQTHFLPESNEHHPDQHDVAWQIVPGQPPVCWIANDGGIGYAFAPYKYFQGGQANHIPIFQIYDLSLADSSEISVGIATQDNKTILYNQANGSRWTGVWAGDGFSVAVNAVQPSKTFMVNNNYLFRTTDGGLTSQYIDIPLIREGRVRYGGRENPNVYVTGWDDGDQVTHDLYVFESANDGSWWNHSNINAFSYNIQNFSVSRGVTPNIYVTLWTPQADWGWGQRMVVRDRITGLWEERTSTLHYGDRVENVIPDPYHPDIAILFMNNELSRSDGQNIFYTDDRGQTWQNITGDLPDIRIRAGQIYPYNRNVIVVGSFDGGCFITLNRGQHWFRWNAGMPEANIVNGFEHIDSVATNGKWYIVASTFGRSLWMREMDDVMWSSVPETQSQSASSYLHVWNANDVVNYQFTSATGGRYVLFVIDATGRMVWETVFSTFSPGTQSGALPLRLPSGLYQLVVRSANEQLSGRFFNP